MKKILIAVVVLGTLQASAETVITYQGSLSANAQPANGVYDFIFEIFPGSTGGTAQAARTNAAVEVKDGLFTTELDFGAAFGSQPQWLAISVRTNGSGGFTMLANRQRIAAAPKAVQALLANTAQVALSAGTSTINSAALQNGTILNEDISGTAAITDSKLATISSAGKVANSATTATSSNQPNTIVLRDSNGDFDAGLGRFEHLDVLGFIRSGNETGTSQPPELPGLVFRRFDSGESANGTIIARTDSCTLVRDGTDAGLRINYTASNESLTFNAIGLTVFGTNVNFRAALFSSSSGFVQVFTTAQRVVHAQISFGNVFGDGDKNVTQVVYDRYDDGSLSDFYLSGTIVSSFNQ